MTNFEVAYPARGLDVDVKGDFYEGLLAKSVQESPKGAGEYFTPRELMKATADVIRPGPDDTVYDHACGTGGFLLSAHDHVVREHGSTLDSDQKRHLRENFVRGWEILSATVRPCIMKLYLRGIGTAQAPRTIGSGQPWQQPRRPFLDGAHQPALRHGARRTRVVADGRSSTANWPSETS